MKTNVNLEGRHSQAALHIAVLNRHEKVVRLLVKSGADVSIWDSDGMTPLSYATDNEDDTVVRLLLENPDIAIGLALHKVACRGPRGYSADVS
jgi:ankyrin repeat protein